MNEYAIICAREKINEARAKQRRLSCEEIRCAEKAQKAIHEQARLEDVICEWEVHIAKLKKEALCPQS